MLSSSSIILDLQSGWLLNLLNSFLMEFLLSNKKSLYFMFSLLKMVLIFLYITDEFDTNTFLKKVFTTLFEWFMPFTKKLDILCIIIFSIDIDFIKGLSRYQGYRPELIYYKTCSNHYVSCYTTEINNIFCILKCMS